LAHSASPASKPKARPRPEISLTDKAYYTLRERILRGLLPPGTALSRRKLAEELGVSFLPVSDAILRLERDGLLESRSRAGTRVRVPTADEIRGRYVVREALESESAKLCCQCATFQERLELRRMGEQLDTLYTHLTDSPDPDLLYVVHQQHMSLHLQIAEYARCPELKEAIERNQVLIYNWFYDMAAQRPSPPEHFHAELTAAVTSDRPEFANKVMREHVRYGLDGILEAVRDHTNSGDWRVKR
jgi:DNA-binding GntR family transcriptional regulator